MWSWTTTAVWNYPVYCSTNTTMTPLGRLLLSTGLLVLLVYISDAAPVPQEEQQVSEPRAVRSVSLQEPPPPSSALQTSPLESGPEVAGEEGGAGSRKKRAPTKKGGWGGGGYGHGGGGRCCGGGYGKKHG